MADFILTDALLRSHSSLFSRWFNETPLNGELATSSFIIASKEVEFPAEEFNSYDTLLGDFGSGYDGIAVPLDSFDTIIGVYDLVFNGEFVSNSWLLGVHENILSVKELISDSDLIGHFTKETKVKGVLTSKSYIICSNLSFITANYNNFILADGDILKVAGAIGCVDISVNPPDLPALTSIDTLEADYKIIGNVKIDWGILTSNDSLSTEFDISVNVEDILTSVDSITFSLYVELSIHWIATPLISYSGLAGTGVVKNPPSGYIMHSTDLISLTQPLDLIKIQEIERCL